jgi:hypothetical protein
MPPAEPGAFDAPRIRLRVDLRAAVRYCNFNLLTLREFLMFDPLTPLLTHESQKHTRGDRDHFQSKLGERLSATRR